MEHMWRFVGVTFYILSCDSMGSNSGFLRALVARVFAHWATLPDPGLEMLVDFSLSYLLFCSCLVLFVCFSFYIHLFIWVYLCVGVSVDVRGPLVGIIGSFLLCGFQEPDSGRKARWQTHWVLSHLADSQVFLCAPDFSSQIFLLSH